MSRRLYHSLYFNASAIIELFYGCWICCSFNAHSHSVHNRDLHDALAALNCLTIHTQTPSDKTHRKSDREICLHKFLNSTSKRLVNLDFNCEKWLLSHTSITFNKVNEKRNSENYRDVIKLMYSMFLQQIVVCVSLFFFSFVCCFPYALATKRTHKWYR